MHSFTLRHLHYFRAVVERGGVTRAARTLSISQSSVSAAVSHLEGIRGTRLLAGGKPTPAGEDFYRAALRLLAEADRLDGENRPQDNQELRLAYFVTFADRVSALLPEFERRFPERRVVACQANHREMLEGLKSRRFELCLAYNMPGESGVTREALGDASLPPYALFSAADPVARRKRVPLRALAEKPAAILNLPVTSEYFASVFAQADVVPRVKHRVSSLDALLALVSAGQAYSILNLSYARAEDSKRFAARPLSEKNLPALRVCALRLSDLRLSPTARDFLEFCRRRKNRWRGPDGAAQAPYFSPQTASKGGAESGSRARRM